jgi:hypothetical protein
MGGASGTGSRSCRIVGFCITGVNLLLNSHSFCFLLPYLKPRNLWKTKTCNRYAELVRDSDCNFTNFKLFNKRNSRNVFQTLETMACLESGHFYIQTIYVCLCEKEEVSSSKWRDKTRSILYFFGRQMFPSADCHLWEFILCHPFVWQDVLASNICTRLSRLKLFIL